MRRIGLSLVLLLLSTAALAGTPKKNGSEPLLQPPSGNFANGEARGARGRNARRAAYRRPLLYARAGRAERARWRGAVPSRSRSLEDPPAIGRRQIGTATWYALPGNLTASGERMDNSRITAAHRSLPLLSHARITNLENGRSVVVLINDRGPMSHRFIIDLSPRAAAAIGMLRSGVAEVEVQPVADEPPWAAPRIAVAE